MRSNPKSSPKNPSELLDARAICLGEYIVAHHATVRSAAKAFGISKSTVHKDISTKLPHLQAALSAEVQSVIAVNKQERHIRGGLATKRKYESEKQNRSLCHPVEPCSVLSDHFHKIH